MKKLSILFLLIFLAGQLLADIRTNGDSLDFSLDSLEVSEASSYVLFSSFVLSASSDEYDNDDYAAVKNRYEYFDQLMAKGDVKAKDIFSQEGLDTYALGENDEIQLDKLNVGILVSSIEKPLIVVPSDVKYAGLNGRSVR
ncbi:MAG: hypothetical protein KBF12_00945 [Sebaldella sp.]|nr:hypothetical protein [Sebaldella sp.]